MLYNISYEVVVTGIRTEQSSEWKLHQGEEEDQRYCVTFRPVISNCAFYQVIEAYKYIRGAKPST